MSLVFLTTVKLQLSHYPAIINLNTTSTKNNNNHSLPFLTYRNDWYTPFFRYTDDKHSKLSKLCSVLLLITNMCSTVFANKKNQKYVQSQERNRKLSLCHLWKHIYFVYKQYCDEINIGENYDKTTAFLNQRTKSFITVLSLQCTLSEPWPHFYMVRTFISNRGYSRDC